MQSARSPDGIDVYVACGQWIGFSQPKEGTECDIISVLGIDFIQDSRIPNYKVINCSFANYPTSDNTLEIR